MERRSCCRLRRSALLPTDSIRKAIQTHQTFSFRLIEKRHFLNAWYERGGLCMKFRSKDFRAGLAAGSAGGDLTKEFP